MNAAVYNLFKIDRVTRFCFVGLLSLINSYFIFMNTKILLVDCSPLNLLFAIIGLGLSILMLYYIPEWIGNRHPIWGNIAFGVLTVIFLPYLFVSFIAISISPGPRVSSYIDWITEPDNLKEVTGLELKGMEVKDFKCDYSKSEGSDCAGSVVIYFSNSPEDILKQFDSLPDYEVIERDDAEFSDCPILISRHIEKDPQDGGYLIRYQNMKLLMNVDMNINANENKAKMYVLHF